MSDIIYLNNNEVADLTRNDLFFEYQSEIDRYEIYQVYKKHSEYTAVHQFLNQKNISGSFNTRTIYNEYIAINKSEISLEEFRGILLAN